MSKIYRKLFQLKWIFMSPRKRYLYLWNRTKRSMRQPVYV
jgi:hypothetical protein